MLPKKYDKCWTNDAEREAYICRFVTESVRSFEEQTLAVRHRWQDAQDLFGGIMDWGDEQSRETWMSRPFVHEFAPIIRRAATALHNTILSQKDFVELSAGPNHDLEFLKIIEKVLRFQVKEIDLVGKFVEFLLCGGVYGVACLKHVIRPTLELKPEVVMKEIDDQNKASVDKLGVDIDVPFTIPDDPDLIQQYLDETTSKILGFGGKLKAPTQEFSKRLRYGPKLELVNPFNIFWWPDAAELNSSPIVIERIWKAAFELMPFFDAGIYDESKRDKLFGLQTSLSSGISNLNSTYEGQKWRQRKQSTDKMEQYPIIELHEYFGPLLDKKGDIIADNCHFVVAGNSVLLKSGKNEYYKQKPPYQFTVFSKVPFNAIGEGIADGARETQKILNQLFGLFIDMLYIDVHNPKVINEDYLTDKSQLEGGIAPGALIGVSGAGQLAVRDLVANLPTNTTSAPQLFQTIEALKLAGQKSASVDTQTSNPSSRARISAHEIGSNAARADESINVLASELDRNCIEPVVSNAYAHVLQYGFERPELDYLKERGIITESEYEFVLNMPRIKRYEELNKSVQVNIRGFRAVVEKNEMLRRATELLSVVTMNPSLQDKLNYGEAIRQIVELYGFDADKWIVQNTQSDSAQEENALLILGRLVQVLPQDDHLAHIMKHYEGMLKSPNQAMLQHIQGHMQFLSEQNIPVPIPPDPIAEYFGFSGTPQELEQMRKAQRLMQ